MAATILAPLGTGGRQVRIGGHRDQGRGDLVGHPLPHRFDERLLEGEAGIID